MFRQQQHADANVIDYVTPARLTRRRDLNPSLDKPLVLLVASQDVVSTMRAEGCPFYFGGDADPATGIDRPLLDAVRLAAHPTDLTRRLGKWADDVQRAAPPGTVATCWHPAVTPDALRQASRYPVHVLRLETAGDAQALIRTLCGTQPPSRPADARTALRA